LKDKVDKFQVDTFCQQTNLCQNEHEIEPCQRCKTHFLTQTNRFRKIVSEITNSLTSLCTNNDCRSLVQSTQQQTLSQIDRIDPTTYCERYGYCLTPPSTSYMAHLLANPTRHSAALDSGFHDRLEIAIRQDICFQYGQFRPMCEHLMASKQAHRFNYIYMSLLKNNPKLIDDDLREQLESKPNQDVCSSCKQSVQTAIDFWKNSLDSVRDVLLRTCQHCSAKEQCEKYYNQRFESLETYLNNFNIEQFCQNVRLCSTSNVIMIDSDQCSTCIQRLDNRRNSLSQTVNRLADYFTEICRQFAPKQCQVFVQQIQTSIQQSIDDFDVNKTCHTIGFCSIDSEMKFDVYEKQLIANLEKNFCEYLGPFQSLCKQTLQGNRKQIQTAKINFNIKDLMQIGEQFSNGLTRNFLSAANLAECNRDKCQCCIDRVNQKKDCWKTFGDKLFDSFSQTCAYCPAKQQCQQYWQTSQTQFDSYINDIDSKQICTRLGYCNASTLCSNMGIFQQACEDALNTFTQSIDKDREQFEKHLPHTSIVVLPTDDNESELTKDSNSTCILCEYVMSILSNYIRQNSTEQEIEQALEKVCNQMPRTLQQQCHELVENYGPPVIAVLIEDFDLKVVCRKLNLCTKQMKVDLTHVNKPSTTACSVCDYVSTYIDFTLKRDPSEKSLQHGLATVCTHLSQTEQQQCQTLLQLFSPNIRQMNLALGKNFCQQLPICQADNTIQPAIIDRLPSQQPSLTKDEQDLKKKIDENLDETPQCMLCHYVITYLDAIIKTNKSEEAIEAALGKVCTILPKKERAQCEQFVKTYGPVLAELISESADPDTVCRYLGMCQVTLPKETSTAKPVTYPNHDYVYLPDEQVTYQCTICQYLIGRMKHFVQENQTEEEILVSLKKSCASFSVINLQQQCENFLDQYGSYMIQMVASDVQPKVACQSLGLCQKDTFIQSVSTKRQSTPATTSSYGKCIFGMSYWCTSRQNAELCNAVELCQNQVWSKKNKNIVI